MEEKEREFTSSSLRPLTGEPSHASGFHHLALRSCLGSQIPHLLWWSEYEINRWWQRFGGIWQLAAGSHMAAGSQEAESSVLT